MARIFIPFLIAAFVCSAQTTKDLLRWMDAAAQRHLDARETAIARITNTADAAQRQAYVRAKVLELIGGLPDYAGPLNARITGKIDATGFVIEKIVFESLPHLYVTANLYRPARAGKFPVVSLGFGHWDYGKPAVQRMAG